LIKLYTWTTPNGRKISIALEELGLPYEVVPIDIGRDEQFDPAFLAISPNNKIPAIVDGDVSLMESGAILLYLAEKTGQLLPSRDTRNYWEVVQWLMWQVAGFGPMLGQAHHFLKFNRGRSTYAEQRYHTEAMRLYSVLDKRLEHREFVAGISSASPISPSGRGPRVSSINRSNSGTIRTYAGGILRWPRARRFSAATGNLGIRARCLCRTDYQCRKGRSHRRNPCR